jgi:ketosteroid isomerase-like protein
VRFRGIWRWLSALGARRLGPHSRLRRATLRRQIRSGWDAAARRDFDLMLVRYSPDVEWEFDPDFEALGLGGTFHGHEGALRMIDAFGEAWEGWEMEAQAVVDLGSDTFVGLGRFRMPGTVSGMEWDREYGQVLTIRDGLCVREQDFFGWDKALRAAGLDPELVRP